jgi:hypothetical protein
MSTPNLASTVPGVPLSAGASSQVLLQQYAQAQQSIAMRAAIAIVGMWNRMIHPDHFNDGWSMLGPLINGIISTHYEATAANAAQYYASTRVTSGFGPFTVPGQDPDMQYIHNVTDAMGPGQFYNYLSNYDSEVASGMARDALRGASTRMVMMGGRDTITNAVRTDPVADGWERVIEPGACGFCAMLASRGAVYKESTVNFRAHDHCHCVARAVFAGQKSVNEDLSRAWGTATAGTRGKAAMQAWNNYWENQNGGRQPEGTAAASERGSRNAAVQQESVRQPALSNQGARL